MSKRTDSHTISHAEDIYSGSGVDGAGSGRGIPRASLVQVDLDSPIVADVNGFFAEDRATAGDFTLDGALQTAGLITLDFPRGVQIVNDSANTAKITFYGTDQYGVLISEELLTNGTTIVFGKKAFKTITRIANDADTTGILTAGSSDILGLPFRLENVADVVVIDENDFNVFEQTAITAAAAAAATAVNPTAPAALTQVAAPAGGSGATAGAYDTAANRDLAIASINAARDDVIALQAEVTTYETAISALIVDVEAIRVEVNKLVTDRTAQDSGALVKADATTATDTTGDVRGTYNPTAVLDGTKNFKLLYKPQKRNTVGAYGVVQFRKAT